MASKSHSSGPGFSGLVEEWRRERNAARRRNSDPLMERIRARRERIRKRIGLLEDCVDLIRQHRDR